MVRKLIPKAVGGYYNMMSYVSPANTAATAFKTFCKVRKGRILPQQESFLRQAMAGREEVAGHELQTYHWPGAGETVLSYLPGYSLRSVLHS